MAYGALGVSHHATEDIAVMRALPNMIVVAPNDPMETREAVKALAGRPGPGYLRLGRAGEPAIHGAGIAFTLGKAIRVREGRDLTLVAAGGLLRNALLAADVLASQGQQARVLSMHTIKPLDENALLSAAKETGAIFTVEEHSVTGGLGGAVAEILLESRARPVRFKRIGLPDAFSSEVGDQDYLRRVYGLDPAGIAASVAAVLRTRA